MHHDSDWNYVNRADQNRVPNLSRARFDYKRKDEDDMAKSTKTKEAKEEKEKREKYEKHLKKAEELIAAGNHKDAVTALGQARLYAKPQDQKKIDEMLEQQKKAMNRGSLFELMEELPAPQFRQYQNYSKQAECTLSI